MDPRVGAYNSQVRVREREREREGEKGYLFGSIEMLRPFTLHPISCAPGDADAGAFCSRNVHVGGSSIWPFEAMKREEKKHRRVSE